MVDSIPVLREIIPCRPLAREALERERGKAGKTEHLLGADFFLFQGSNTVGAIKEGLEEHRGK